MNIVIKDETEERFRRAVFESKGFKKGNISEAMEEAIQLWIARQDQKRVKKSA